MIENVMEKWFAVVGGDGDIRELLHEDCVLVACTLSSAGRSRVNSNVFICSRHGFPRTTKRKAMRASLGVWYTKRVFDGNHAVLEFETTMDGVSVNGVDIISCDDDGKIVEFKVMLRPQKAVQKHVSK